MIENVLIIATCMFCLSAMIWIVSGSLSYRKAEEEFKSSKCRTCQYLEKLRETEKAYINTWINSFPKKPPTNLICDFQYLCNYVNILEAKLNDD